MTQPARLDYKLPAGWKEQPASSMRAASFVVAGKESQADVSVIPLPGMAGRELEIVNLWREQLQLPAATQDDVGKLMETITVGPGQGKFAEMVSAEKIIDGKSRARLLVAMLTKDDTTWFFKMSGEDSLVAEQKPAFVEFLKSVSFNAPASPAQLTGTPPTAVETPRENSNSQLPQWNAPSNWQSQPPGEMLLASFAVADEKLGKATVTVSAFPGDVGGLLANVNRWRRQIGLGEVAEADLPKLVTALDAAAGPAKLVDLAGANTRIVGAVVPYKGQTWFYKMMGDEKIVEQQRDAFIKFVQTVKY